MLCGNTRAGLRSQVPSPSESHLFHEIIALYSWLVTENHKPIPRIKVSLWPQNLEDECGVMSEVFAFLVGDVVVICLPAAAEAVRLVCTALQRQITMAVMERSSL